MAGSPDGPVPSLGVPGAPSLRSRSGRSELPRQLGRLDATSAEASSRPEQSPLPTRARFFFTAENGASLDSSLSTFGALCEFAGASGYLTRRARRLPWRSTDPLI
jgi:hypothetical protein